MINHFHLNCCTGNFIYRLRIPNQFAQPLNGRGGGSRIPLAKTVKVRTAIKGMFFNAFSSENGQTYLFGLQVCKRVFILKIRPEKPYILVWNRSVRTRRYKTSKTSEGCPTRRGGAAKAVLSSCWSQLRISSRASKDRTTLYDLL